MERVQRFEILGVLGEGGMGRVYRARDPQLERDVAIKILATQHKPPELSSDITVDLRGDAPSSPDDLLNEARMMARLSHQNVLPVYEVGLAETGEVFLVMEHIDGMDLAAWLAERRTTAQILAVFAQVAHGLAAAHERGIVHRDIKPANMLVGRDGRVRVADFGLSRLTGRAPGAMVRIEDGYGTPAYMAPELWHGAAATPKSDVYALCVTLLDALGHEPRELPAPVKQVLDAGIAEDPAQRPELREVIAALEGRRSHGRRWWIAGAAAGASAIAVVVALVVLRDSTPACEIDGTLFDGRYDVARRAAVQKTLAPFGDQLGKAGPQVLATFDEQKRAIEDIEAATCKAVRAGQITDAQRASRMSCLARLAFDLGGIIDRQLVANDGVDQARVRTGSVWPASDCSSITAPPLPADHRAVEALWKRFEASDAHANAADAKLHVPELLEIERRAKELGEQQLVARAEMWLGIEYKFLDDHAKADEAFLRAYHAGVELNAPELQLQAVWQRSKLASWGRHDAASGRELAALAVDLAKRPGTSVHGRANALHAAAIAASAGGDSATAIVHLRQALTVLATTPRRFPTTELNIRFSLLDAMNSTGKDVKALLQVAKETVAVVKTLQGDHDGFMAVAYNFLALAMRRSGDIAGALPYRKQALAIMEETMPKGSGSIMGMRADYASDLIVIGELETARRELAAVIEQARTNQMLRSGLPLTLGLYSTALFQLGRYDQAFDAIDQALEENLSRSGKEHLMSYEIRTARAQMHLELRRFDAAARDLASLDASFRANPAGNELRAQMVHGSQEAELALGRGRAKDAEALTRGALASIDELHATDENRADLNLELGRALLAQKRWSEARDVLERAHALYESGQPRANLLAAVDVELARADAGLGKRADAVARARRARAVFDKFRGNVVARREADALLRR